MAELVNTHIEAIRNSFESEVASLLLKLPDNWMIWHEPVVGERLTPDFIIFVTFSNRLALFILEVKDWLDKYIEFNDEHNSVQLRGRPPEEEPIHKLIRVENIFFDRLRGLNRLNPIFKDIPVISYLGFKQRIEEINRHFIDDGRIKVFPEIGNNLKKFKRELEQFTLEKNFIFNYKINDLKEVRNNVCLKSAVPLPSNLINQKDIKLRKQIGFLDDKQRRTVENRDLGHLRLSGFPGTGKTIVLLARLSWYARRFPEKNYLFVVTQATLRTNIEQKYWAYFANEGDSKKKISFVRFEDWLKDSTEGIKQELLNNPFKRKNEIILNYCKGLLNGTKVFKDSDKSAYGYIFVDEAHQMFPEWINVLTMCAEKDKDKRNIWIAADNGQCIYQKRKFDEGSINLNFQGRGVIFNRIYRSGLYP